ncbi:hypothetical protein [Modestobacter sp. Leaf380]|uniref:hypothetical protein n=1 Tax=Modestobacter sp. Leaf380 TaxID=1736356 RepID=UPI0006F63985|nr:hypothetical protein [Modestobacter sp. Leaf380]KQS66905.1 hypothetical protein ASG41_10975 [Modestobacter sp. Leaf380]
MTDTAGHAPAGPRARLLLAVAGVLGVLSPGLPWGVLPGTAHPARVAVLGAAVLAALALRTGRARLLTAAAAVGAVGVLLGGLDATPGRLALAGAVACLVLAALAERSPAAAPEARSETRSEACSEA